LLSWKEQQKFLRKYLVTCKLGPGTGFLDMNWCLRYEAAAACVITSIIVIVKM